MSRAVAVIDGEHYAPVVRDALAHLPHEIVGAWLAGGTEKLRPGADYGVPLFDSLEAALAEGRPELVVDLSDEPVLGPVERFRVASRVLARGLPYEGPGFRFDPPVLAALDAPALAIIGTGKRVGKTAVTGYAARLLARSRDVVVVAMGRGGPPDPELVELRPTVADLLELSRAGRHAASDYLETAALAGVVTVGCRRCGGGLAGAVADSNVVEGVRLALERSPDLVLLDGSGAALPPVEARARVLVAGAHQGPELVTGYLNGYRVLVSELVLVTMAEDGAERAVLRAIEELAPGKPAIACVLRPRPLEPVAGKRVAFFTTARPDAHGRLERHLREEHGIDVVAVSGSLTRREELERDLERIDAEVYLVEIKAAAIDVVAERAAERGVEVVFADSDVLPLPGQPDLDAAIEQLAETAAREAVTG
jgi:cyclic 2,3-diphosphoglycerate synthetase